MEMMKRFPVRRYAMLNPAALPRGANRVCCYKTCVCPCGPLLAQSFQCGFDISGVLQVFFFVQLSRESCVFFRLAMGDSKLVLLAFNCRAETSFGQEIRVVGSTKELGNWNPASAPSLKTELTRNFGRVCLPPVSPAVQPFAAMAAMAVTATGVPTAGPIARSPLSPTPHALAGPALQRTWPRETSDHHGSLAVPAGLLVTWVASRISRHRRRTPRQFTKSENHDPKDGVSFGFDATLGKRFAEIAETCTRYPAAFWCCRAVS
eukprot:s218_g9.t1